MDPQKLRAQRETVLVAFLLLIGSLIILYPFLDAIVIAIVVAYLLSFAHKVMSKKIQSELIASIVVVSSVIGTISLLIYFFINNFFVILSQVNVITGLLTESILTAVDFLNLPEQFQQNLESFITRFSEGITDLMISIFTSVPLLLVHVGIFLVTTLFLYKDREIIKNQIYGFVQTLPEPEKNVVRTLIDSTDQIFRGVFITQFIVAGIIGLTAAIGFYIITLLTSPIPFLAFWVGLIAVAALVPIFAAFMVYGPIGIYYMLMGAPVKGSLILTFGIIALNLLPELFLRPYVGSRQMDEHPLVIFLGFLTGPLVLGVKGVILGPLLLILAKEFALNYPNAVYSKDQKNRN